MVQAKVVSFFLHWCNRETNKAITAQLSVNLCHPRKTKLNRSGLKTWEFTVQAECTFLLALRLWLSSPCYAMSPLINVASIRGTWSYQKGFGSTWKLPCLLLEVKRGAVVIPGSKTVQENKHLRNVRDMFQWFHNLILLHTFYMKSYTISSVSSYVKKKNSPLAFLLDHLCDTKKHYILST